MRSTSEKTATKKPKEFSAFSDITADLLLSRGINTWALAEAFLSPDYEKHVHDPFLMKDMDKAVERVYQAVKNEEKIIIYSDYDADGIPGGAILHDLLRKIGHKNFENYIPHRHDEGFGLNIKAIEEFKKNKAGLIITIDCGIADIEEVERVSELDMDVIVTDHHMPLVEKDGKSQKLPKAFAILNPKVESCTYPEKMLCGAGVIFKFIQAFLKKHGEEFKVKAGWEKWCLDLVSIATLSDMVPLVGENRVFAFYGLKVLRKTPRPGLSKLFSKLRIKREHITEDDIGFTITPRINAASRMGEPKVAFDLLSTDDEILAGVSADMLEHVNNERKGTVASLVKEIKKILLERGVGDKKVIVLGNPSWRPSLLGLVANSLAEEYGRPAFLWGRDGEGVIKGSCRGGVNGDVLSIMRKASDCFIAFGGHFASGGFEVSPENIHFLAERLEEAALKVDKETPVMLSKKDETDAMISVEDVSWDLYKDIERLAPFGTGNPKPLFMVKGALVDSVKSFGKENNHTTIVVKDLGGRRISAMKFFMAKDSLPAHVKPGVSVDILAHLEKSVFKNYPELRLRVIDII